MLPGSRICTLAAVLDAFPQTCPGSRGRPIDVGEDRVEGTCHVCGQRLFLAYAGLLPTHDARGDTESPTSGPGDGVST